MEASERTRVPVLGVFPGVVMVLVSSTKVAFLAPESRFEAVEELTMSVESSMIDDMSWTGAGAVKTTEPIVTFLRFSGEGRAEEVGDERFPPFLEDRGWSNPSSNSRGDGGDGALRLDVL